MVALPSTCRTRGPAPAQHGRLGATRQAERRAKARATYLQLGLCLVVEVRWKRADRMDQQEEKDEERPGVRDRRSPNDHHAHLGRRRAEI